MLIGQEVGGHGPARHPHHQVVSEAPLLVVEAGIRDAKRKLGEISVLLGQEVAYKFLVDLHFRSRPRHVRTLESAGVDSGRTAL